MLKKMSGKSRPVAVHAHLPGAFAIRGRAIRTFGGQALVLTISLLILGVYLIANEFKNPLSSQSIGLFTAAFILATAMTLLIELTQLFRAIRRTNAPNDPILIVHQTQAVTGIRSPIRRRHQPPTLPYHRSYIDRVRIRA
jgi:hypothetical protein